MKLADIPLKALVAFPLAGALAVQYALTAPLVGGNVGQGGMRTTQGHEPIVYEVTVRQDGQEVAQSTISLQAQETQSGLGGVVSDESQGAQQAASRQGASEVFLQALQEPGALAEESGSDASQSTIRMLNGAIGRRIVGAKVAKKQASQQFAQEYAAARLQERADTVSKLVVNGSAISQSRAKDLAQLKPDYEQHVKYIDQRKVMPSGCEIMALTVTLNSMGFDAEATDIADKHLAYGGDSKNRYTGSPYSNGGGFPPCIVDAANSWLKANDGAAQAYDLTGTSYKDLKALVELGYPVLVWTTEAMATPYVYSTWYNPEHCVVLYGFEDGKALVSDSLEGLVKRDDKRFGEIYETAGKHAAFIQPKSAE